MAATEIMKRTYAPSAMVGQLYAKVYGSTGPFLPVGNVLELQTEYKETVEKQTDMSKLGGGVHAEIRRVEEVNFKAKLADLNVVNLTRAVLGTASPVDAGTVTDAAYTAKLGGLLALPHTKLSAVVVKKGAATVDAAGYEVRPEGIWFPETVVGLTDGDAITVSYSYGDQVVIEALTTKAAELVFRFAGLNEADSGKSVLVDMHRVSQGVTKQLSFIQDKGFGSLEVEGALLKDPSKTGAGVSAYMKTTHA